MNRKKICILIGLAYIFLRLLGPLMHHHEVKAPTLTHKKEPVKQAPIKPEKEEEDETADAEDSHEESDDVKVPKKFHASNSGKLKKISFEQLPGWENAEVKKSLFAFQKSCITFLKQKPNKQVGSSQIDLQAGDWRPACKEALSIDSITENAARSFFEKWFSPIKFDQKKKAQGLFTGYYMPSIKGSLNRTSEFTTPIYGIPKKLSKKSSKPHYSREEIDSGALGKQAPVIAWVSSPVDRLSLEIEGSGEVKLDNGKSLYLGYAGENGGKYTSVGSVLIKKGIMTRNNASKNAIKRYLEQHPSEMKTILNKNKSFVFFQKLKQPIGIGTKDIALTPGYSLAVDRKYIPYGAPLWLATKKPNVSTDAPVKFQRLMIAQDTGGAIRGLMRGDIYWGSGKAASFLGENMKTKGRYWMLVPKLALTRLAMKFGVKAN